MRKTSALCLICAIAAGIGLLMTSTADCKPIELKMSHFMPTKHTQHKVMAKWADEVTKQSNGRIKVTIFPGGALGKPPHQYDSAVKGITDIAFGLQAYTAGRFPLTSVMRLPFMVESGEQGSRVLWEMYEKYLREEYKDTKVLWLFCHGPGQIMTTKKQVTTLKDLRGLKLRTPGAIMSKVLKAYGAAPVTMPITQVYTALERRTVDGLSGPWEVMRPFRFYERIKFTTEANIYTQTFFVVMNKQKYESLPADLKQVIDDTTGRQMAIAAGRAYDNSDAPSRKLCLDKGIKVYTLPSAEVNKWEQAAMPIQDAWLEDKESKGLAGKVVLEYALEALK